MTDRHQNSGPVARSQKRRETGHSELPRTARRAGGRTGTWFAASCGAVPQKGFVSRNAAPPRTEHYGHWASERRPTQPNRSPAVPSVTPCSRGVPSGESPLHIRRCRRNLRTPIPSCRGVREGFHPRDEGSLAVAGVLRNCMQGIGTKLSFHSIALRIMPFRIHGSENHRFGSRTWYS